MLKNSIKPSVLICGLLAILALIAMQQNRVLADATNSSAQNYQAQLMDLDYEISVISKDSDGTMGQNSSKRPSISTNGAFVAFESNFENDADIAVNTFIYRKEIGASTLISVSVAANGDIAHGAKPAISADGSLVAFESDTAISAQDNNDARDIYVEDIETGSTTLHSRQPNGNAPQDFDGEPMASNEASIGVDSQANIFVSFKSTAIDLLDDPQEDIEDNNQTFDIFRSNGQTTLVSQATNESATANKRSNAPVMSHNGAYVAFYSKSNNMGNLDDLAEGELNADKVFRWDQSSNSVDFVGLGKNPSISADGSLVAYVTNADVNGCSQIRVASLFNGNPQPLISAPDLNGIGVQIHYENPTISANGRWLAYVLKTGSLCGSESDELNVYVKDLSTQGSMPILVSRTAADNMGDGSSYNPVVAANGNDLFVAFESWAKDLDIPTEDNDTVNEISKSQIYLFKLDINSISGGTETETPTSTPTATATNTPVATATTTPEPTETPDGPGAGDGLVYLPILNNPAEPTPTPTPSNPVQNGNFEDRINPDTNWTFSDGPFSVLRISENSIEDISARIGTPGIAVGEVPVGYGQMHQTFTIPASADSLTFDMIVYSQDRMFNPNNRRLFDTFELYILDATLNSDESQITDDDRQVACADHPHNAYNGLVASKGILIFCSGHNGNTSGDEGAAENTYPADGNAGTQTIDVSAFQNKQVRLVVRVTNRIDGKFNTWAIVDNFEIK